MLKDRLERWRTEFRQTLLADITAFLHPELAALRAELQAERAAFAHALEQQRQSNEANLLAQRAQLERLEKAYDALGMAKLTSTLDAALLTLALHKDAVHNSSSVHSDSA